MLTKRSMGELADDEEVGHGIRLAAMHSTRSVKARARLGKEHDTRTRELFVRFAADRIGLGIKFRLGDDLMPILIDLMSLDDAQRLVTDLSTGIELARLATEMLNKPRKSNRPTTDES